MLSVNSVRDAFRSEGPRGFAIKFRNALGLCDATGKPHTDLVSGNRILVKPKNPAPPVESMSMKTIYEGMFGDDGGRSIVMRNVMEDGTEIVPTAFANVSAYNAAAIGLLEAKFLETYTRPEFLADQLTMLDANNKIQQKYIGISMVGDVAVERRPGDRHLRINLSERYVVTPENINRGVSIDVTQEAVMFDRTAQLLTQAEEGAKVLALRKEFIVLDTFMGINNTYNYGGTTYNTYATSGNWVNLVTGNALVNWTNIDTVMQLFSRMTDQETNQPITVIPKDLLVMPYKFITARGILNYTSIQRRQGSGSFATELGNGANPLDQYQLNLVGYPTYPYARQELVGPGGISGTPGGAADNYWWMGDFKRAFVYTQNKPLTILRATPTDYEMADRSLVFSMFADEMGNAGVRDPRYVALSTS